METVVLRISGMTCMGCVASVRRVLQSVAGVSHVDVSLEQKIATVNYDAAKTDRAQLGAVVREAGYDIA